jgi:hypothetical protein
MLLLRIALKIGIKVRASRVAGDEDAVNSTDRPQPFSVEA